ncbi:MAG: hypothetical protein KAJ76_02425 [Candidatus Heimdallarchaeota archaeon]|nr:hypothetical protein [Candidatus Heimdallarchaeota archaeon]MCK5158066.1 hypothetical protein [Candidatus Heimdallarchaeota archaeon]MCK5297733.1 hypothetical protein [Candidatus Heimdallarchaeota archaeon]
MSLKNARTYKSGILLQDSEKLTLIVPLQIHLATDFNKQIRIPQKINQLIYGLLLQNVARYTFIFDRNELNQPKLLQYIYFTGINQTELLTKVKSTINSFVRFLADLKLKVKILDSKQTLQQMLDSIPNSINEVTPGLYQISLEKSKAFLSVAKLFFTNDSNKGDLIYFMNDFYSHLSQGRLNIDIQRKTKKKQSDFQTTASVTIILENEKLEEIKLAQKKLATLLKVFSNHMSEEEKKNFWFLNPSELMSNLGKIMVGQGPKYFPADHNNLLDFSAFFNLLIDNK